MRYNIIDTDSSSGTKARELFKYQWDNIISTIDKFSMSEPNKTILASDSDSISLADQDMDQNDRAEDIRQYLTKISKNMVVDFDLLLVFYKPVLRKKFPWTIYVYFIRTL